MVSVGAASALVEPSAGAVERGSVGVKGGQHPCPGQSSRQWVVS